MSEGSTPKPITSDNVDTWLCTVQGVAHDFRLREWQTAWNTVRTSWVCIWCNGIACGDHDEVDPCWLIYHHPTAHKTRSGVVWPLGGARPRPTAKAG
jgi:hypothetical protein